MIKTQEQIKYYAPADGANFGKKLIPAMPKF